MRSKSTRTSNARSHVFSFTPAVAAFLLLSMSATSAYAWVPPERLLRHWQPYEQIGDLDAVSMLPNVADADAGMPKPFITVEQELPFTPVVKSSSTQESGHASSTAPIAQAVQSSATVTQNPVMQPTVAYTGPHNTYIQQTIEEAPVQSLVYAPTAQTIIRATQNIYNNNIISILQQCGDFCTQFINVNAIANAFANQNINGSATNNGVINQTGTFFGTGSGSSAGAQSLTSNPSASTTIHNDTNVLGGNAMDILQTGTNGMQNVNMGVESIVNPLSTLNGTSANTTSALQVLPQQ